MDSLFLFDPRKKEYKSPFGAVKCGECVHISVKSARVFAKSISLVALNEYTGKTDSHPLEWENSYCGYDTYSADLKAADEPCIIWYCFEIKSCSGELFYFGKNGLMSSIDAVARFQMTVYSNEYVTPSWFSEGVTYHVFVDRFNRGKASSELKKDEYFYVHQSHSETPMYKPNENGVVENRDIYGGDLKGVIDKLAYLKNLGVKTIYLSPIFEAWSNHKYNTADYMKIDSHFGKTSDLKSLCAKASKLGIRVILDGVFSHTGSDSIYFNREGRYGEAVGAYRNPNSQYRKWYDFDQNGKYSSWWGIDTLPQTNELDEDYQSFIYGDKNSVISKWMQAGVSGWRLDVADELPDEFIEKLRFRAKSEKSDALVIGEVWEDASTKKAYGVNKKYFTAGVLDGVMNYPLKNAIIAFLKGEIRGTAFADALNSILENYPEQSLNCLMNIIGTHDTVRILTELSVDGFWQKDKSERAEYYLSEEEMKKGKERLKQAAVMQYMFPGSPCIYYGDEVGMQGFEDPFNRRYFPWDDIDEELICFYKKLGEIKTGFEDMQKGKLGFSCVRNDVVVMSRGCIYAFVNRGKRASAFKVNKSEILVENSGCTIKNNVLLLPGNSCCIIKSDFDK